MSKAMCWSALLVFCLAGCAFFSPGQTHVGYNRSIGTLAMTVASKPGRYALYVGDDPIACAVLVLKKGEPLGFEYNDEHRVRAIAGDYSTTLPSSVGTAQWTFAAQTRQALLEQSRVSDTR